MPLETALIHLVTKGLTLLVSVLFLRRVKRSKQGSSNFSGINPDKKKGKKGGAKVERIGVKYRF